MPITVDGQRYFRTAEVCYLIGISKTTLFRWLKQGTFGDARYRDRRGWRAFNEDEVNRLKAEANRLTENK